MNSTTCEEIIEKRISFVSWIKSSFRHSPPEMSRDYPCCASTCWGRYLAASQLTDTHRGHRRPADSHHQVISLVL